MSLRLYFLRHGQTAASRGNQFCGSGSNPPLTPDGLKMAEQFAEKYSCIKWKAVYASPLLRAQQTALCLTDKISSPLTTDDDLKEIDFGEWEGKTVEIVNAEFHDDYVRWMADPGWCAPTGGETATVIAQRGSRFLDRVLSEHVEGDVLAVSHKATIRIMLCTLLGIDVGRFRFRLDCPVCSVSLVEFTSQGPLLRRLADRGHLSDELRNLPGT